MAIAAALSIPGARAADPLPQAGVEASTAVAKPIKAAAATSAKKPPEKAGEKPVDKPAKTSGKTDAAAKTPVVLKGAPVKKTPPVGAAGKKPSAPSTPEKKKVAAAKKPSDKADAKKGPRSVGPIVLKPLLSEPDKAIYKEAFARAAEGKWPEVQKLSAQAKEKLPGKLLRMMELASSTDFAAVTQFMADNPDWPYANSLRLRAENSVFAQSDSVILDWFKKNPPQTPQGHVTLADVSRRTGQDAEADRLVRNAWLIANFDAGEERAFLDKHRRVLREEDYLARLDRLLWDDQVPAARRMLQYVDQKYRLLTDARIRLMKLERGAIAASVARVPAEFSNDAGLTFERLRYRRRQNDFDGARDLLLNLPHDLRRPAEWWTELSYVIRRTLASGDAPLAYRIVKEHRQDGGTTRAEAEFLAGWIALRALRDTAAANGHFKTLYETVKYPVSLARAAYWLGRTAEAADDRATAQRWYRNGAKHLTTFYGQLSAGRAGIEVAVLPPEPQPTQAQIAEFERAELPRLTRMLAEIDQRDRVSLLFRIMAQNARAPYEFVLVGRQATLMDMPDQAVRVARRAERAGVPLTVQGYPVLPLKTAPDKLDSALVHALIRQESGFDREAISRAGARGLMQLMPDTARLVAKELNVAYQPHYLTDDAAFNVTLGRAYLQQMIEETGAVPAALAAYNAGPGRAKRWMRENGDPRVDEDALVDWIETIPFDETRNYVQRVLESEFVYRRRDAKPPKPEMESAGFIPVSTPR